MGERGTSQMRVAPECSGRAQVVQLVANPAAGDGHSASRVEALARAFARAGAEVIRTECGPACDLEVDGRADHVCVVGGDGTVRHAAIAADRCGRQVVLSLYPGGTVNLIHRETLSELDPDRFALRILRPRSPRHHYAARLGKTFFLSCASVGPDSAAVAAVSPWLKRKIGRKAYALAFLGTLLFWPRHRMTLRCGGRGLHCEAFYVAKGRFFAGPWSFAPDARIDDPTLHVVALTRATRLNYLRFMWALYRDKPVEHLSCVKTFTCTELEVDCAKPLPVQADGDIAATLPIDIAIRPEPFVFH
jgi:diacylglycerol kinase (ATP)